MKTLIVLSCMMGALCALAIRPVSHITICNSVRTYPVLVKPKIKRVDWHSLAIDKIKSFESYKPNPYFCPAGVLTVGYGHTGKHASSSMSQAKAHAVLCHELEQTKSFVLKHVKVRLTEYQLYALVSFTHNTNESCLLTLINGPNRLNSGNYASVPKLLPLYNKGGGKVLRGLVKRRAVEVRMWKGCV
jgi:lysozyme